MYRHITLRNVHNIIVIMVPLQLIITNIMC